MLFPRDGLLSPNFVLEEVTQSDMIIASLAWGFTLGIGWLTSWTAVKQTMGVYRRRKWAVLRNAYVIMIWGEISVCLAFGIICYMHLNGAIPPSFAFYFCILTTWALQVQFLLQIIINRCSILVHDKKFVWRLKYGVAALITAINISVYCIWVPARLQISERYIHTNEVWDRCEKVIYLIVDAWLNILFVRIVKQNLVSHGLLKYKGLVNFNMFIIGFSLSMDVLIISMMSLKNTFVYMQFHPLAYIVKLNIEMSMAKLIAKLAKNSVHDLPYDNSNSHGTTTGGHKNTTVSGTRGTRRGTKLFTNTDAKNGDDLDDGSGGDPENGRVWATVTTTVEMETLKASRPNDHRSALGLHNDDEDRLINRGSAMYGHEATASGPPRGSDSLRSEDSDAVEAVPSR